ncbi:HEPACAM family member 2 [Pantherophis guttatus]|uniref:HEPACAM family member 2 n=1 Tax=Pantherophis guttatus TaxID=94885 RepID=A0A6P9AL57_PANGU|nr:HEPACAM family member 2 [Pantherophis guttatus]XP_034257980.1 HEPACAM family member 2 [Pantherophis guttatus]
MAFTQNKLLFNTMLCGLQIYVLYLLLGNSSALKMTIPSYTVNGIEGQPLRLDIAYNVNFAISELQIIWLFEKPPTNPKYLISSANQSVVPDIEYRHKFTLSPPNASLLINSLHRSDEGNYIVKINIDGNETKSVSEKIQVTVDVPLTKPVIYMEPSFGVVEKKGNITLKCRVEEGTRIVYQWMKNENPIEDSNNGSMTINKDTLSIAPVFREAIGNYSCLVTNPISAMRSDMITPTIYYGPYELTINTAKGQKVGKVFTLDKGDAVQLYCSADSNPPNIYSWILKANNSIYSVQYGRFLEIASEKVTQKTEYICTAYNNMTETHVETHILVIVIPKGLDQLAQKGKYLSPLAIITGISLFLIVSICIFALWKRFRLYKGKQQKSNRKAPRTKARYRKGQNKSGHENTGEGVYEFIECAGSAGTPWPPRRRVTDSDVGQSQSVNVTVYDVVQHVPEQNQEQQDDA